MLQQQRKSACFIISRSFIYISLQKNNLKIQYTAWQREIGQIYVLNFPSLTSDLTDFFNSIEHFYNYLVSSPANIIFLTDKLLIVTIQIEGYCHVLRLPVHRIERNVQYVSKRLTYYKGRAADYQLKARKQLQRIEIQQMLKTLELLQDHKEKAKKELQNESQKVQLLKKRLLQQKQLSANLQKMVLQKEDFMQEIQFDG